MLYFALGYAVVAAVLSMIAFVSYGFDKRRARAGGRRVPERTLHVMALLGGWPGALLAQRVFRHKTQKVAFRIVFWLCVMTHAAILTGVVYLLLV